MNIIELAGAFVVGGIAAIAIAGSIQFWIELHPSFAERVDRRVREWKEQTRWLLTEFGTCATCAKDIDEPGWICCDFTFCGEACQEVHQASEEHDA